MRKILILLLISILSISQTNAWLGLIAENGDLLNIVKWNELVNDKLSRVDLKAGTGVTLTNSGSEIYINGIVSGQGVPYISNNNQISLPTETTRNITLNGRNFTPETTVSTQAGTISNLQIFSPVELSFDLTSGTTEGNFDIILDNNGVQNTYWTGNGVDLISIGDILGTGSAGTYTEDFEAGMGSWVSSGLTGDWTRDSGGTPSSGTGPNNGAGGSTWYVFTEVSSGADSNEFGIETSDFRHATSVSLDYHMTGDNIGNLYIQTLNDGNWTTVWSISGEQQAAQSDAFINTGDIDLTGYNVEKIRVLMNGATGWAGDTTVDNISIVSD